MHRTLAFLLLKGIDDEDSDDACDIFAPCRLVHETLNAMTQEKRAASIELKKKLFEATLETALYALWLCNGKSSAGGHLRTNFVNPPL